MRLSPALERFAVFAAKELAEVGYILESAGLCDCRGRELRGEEALGDLFKADAGDGLEDRLALELPEAEVGEAA